MNTIQEEHSRLVAFLATETGWSQFDEAWQIALNYEKRDGNWFKRACSDGDKVAGFAIDIVSWKYAIGAYGREHHQARHDLIRALHKEATPETADRCEAGVVEGRLAKIEGWAYPVVTLWGFIESAALVAIEKRVLELEIGLPVTSLYRTHRKMEGCV